MGVSKRAIVAGIVVFVLAMSAQATDYKNEYDKKIKAAQNVGVLGNDLAGDSINFYTGAVSFNVTDISLPGNAMGLSLGRSYSVEFDHYEYAIPGTVDPYEPELFYRRLYTFGDWDLDVPHIRAVMKQDGGWVVDSQTPTNRCSVIGQLKADASGPATGAPPMAFGTRGWHFSAGMYWSGYDMHVPGGDQSLLLATETIPTGQKPGMGGPYHWTTNKDWWLSCVAAANTTGEGFMALSPDGTTYRFDWMSTRKINSVSDRDPEEMQSQNPSYLFRSEYRLLPTEIKDRFGNRVTYTWSNHEFARLLSVSSFVAGTAQAEHTITLTYNSDGYVSEASDGTRTWHYTYDDGTLVAVTLPDDTSWTYLLDSNYRSDEFETYCGPDYDGTPKNSPYYQWACFGRGDMPPLNAKGTVTHPSGAKIEFEWTNRFIYSPNANGMYPIGLKSKTITGPGMAAATWKYDFAFSKDELRDRCAPLDGASYSCPMQRLVDELSPDGSLTRRIFGILGVNEETVLLGEFHGSLTANGGGSPTIGCNADWGCGLRDETTPFSGAAPVFYEEIQYKRVQAGAAVGYIEKLGVNPLLPMTPGAQVYASERRIPTIVRTMQRQGAVLTNTVNAFNEFAQPTSVTRSSTGSAGGNNSRTEVTTYAHDTAKWVIGLPACVGDGAACTPPPATPTVLEISKTEYNAAMLPWKTYKFGLLQNTLTYNGNGTLAKVVDGRGNEILLSNWYRGIPQRIDYPTSAYETATVNALGWITSTKDELSNVTSYGYDTMGRLSGITYPTADTTAWNPLARVFDKVTGAEYGIAAGHWKQTVNTGNGKTTTYYDALWRPVLVVTEDTGNAASKSFVVTRYDAEGRVAFQSYPVGSLTTVNDTLTGVTTTYDALGRVYQVKQDSELGLLTTTNEYLTGFITRVTNPRGYVTETKYQLFDSPSTDSPVEIVTAKDEPEQQTTAIVRDRFGKPLSVTRSGAAP